MEECAGRAWWCLPFDPSLLRFSFFSFLKKYLYIDRRRSRAAPRLSLFWGLLGRGPRVGARPFPRRAEGVHVFVLLPQLCVFGSASEETPKSRNARAASPKGPFPHPITTDLLRRRRVHPVGRPKGVERTLHDEERAPSVPQDRHLRLVRREEGRRRRDSVH